MIEIPAEWSNLTNIEIAQLLNVSTTGVIYAKRRAAGLCERCGKKPATDGRYCAKHAKAVRTYQRVRKGHKPWKPGGRGRPPIKEVTA